MSGLVIIIVFLAIIWGVGKARRPRHASGGPTHVPATDAEAWRSLVRPVRFTAPVAYSTLGSAIRDCVGTDVGLGAAGPRFVQRALESQRTTFVYGTRERRLFVVTLVGEPDGTGSRGRLEVTPSTDEVVDSAQHRALRQLRTRVADAVSRVGGQVRDR